MIRDFGLVKWLLVIFMGAFGALLGLFLTIEATGAFRFLPDPFGLEIPRQVLGFIAGAIVGAIVGYLVAYWLVARERMHGAPPESNGKEVGSDDDEWPTASSTGRRGTLALLLFGGSLIALLVAGWMVDRGSADTPEVTLALVLLAGVVILLVAIAALAVVISEFGLAGNKAAFGLPPGTVRAIIALALVLIFAIISVFLLTSTTVPQAEFVSTGLTEAQYRALENVDVVSVTRVSTDADGDTLYNVRVVRSGEQPGELTQQLTLQLMAILGTLIAAVVGFYFGSGGSTTPKDARVGAGEPGESGKDGKDGKDGEPGESGKDGKPGEPVTSTISIVKARCPKHQPQLNRAKTGSVDCGPRSWQMGIDVQTGGVKRPGPSLLRRLAGKPGSVVTNVSDAKKAVESFRDIKGLRPLRYVKKENRPWAEAEKALRRRRAVHLAISYGVVNARIPEKSGDPNFDGGHSILVFGIKRRPDGHGWLVGVNDPLADGRRPGIPKGRQWWPLGVVRDAAGKLAGGNDRFYGGIFRPGRQVGETDLPDTGPEVEDKDLPLNQDHAKQGEDEGVMASAFDEAMHADDESILRDDDILDEEDELDPGEEGSATEEFDPDEGKENP